MRTRDSLRFVPPLAFFSLFFSANHQPSWQLKCHHETNHQLKEDQAKSKLQKRLNALRKPDVDLDIGAVQSSPLNTWMQTSVVEDLGAISGDIKAQSENFLDKAKIESLASLVDEIESECSDLLGSHLNNQPVAEKAQLTQELVSNLREKLAKVNADETAMKDIFDLKAKAMQGEIDELSSELQEKEASLYVIEEKLAEAEEEKELLKSEIDKLQAEKDKAWFKTKQSLGGSSDEEAGSSSELAAPQSPENVAKDGTVQVLEEVKQENLILKKQVKDLEEEKEAESS